MIYQCNQCGGPLPARVVSCPRCRKQFLEAVPSDAEMSKRGFTAVEPAPSGPSPPVQPSPEEPESPAILFQFAPALDAEPVDRLSEPVPPLPVPPLPVPPAQPTETVSFGGMSLEPEPVDPHSLPPSEAPEPASEAPETLLGRRRSLPVRYIGLIAGVIASVLAAVLIFSTVHRAPTRSNPAVATSTPPVPPTTAASVNASPPLPAAPPIALPSTPPAGLPPFPLHRAMRHQRLHEIALRPARKAKPVKRQVLQRRLLADNAVVVTPRTVALLPEAAHKPRRLPVSEHGSRHDPALQRRQLQLARRQRGLKHIPLRKRKMLYTQYWRAWDLAQKRTSAAYLMSSPRSMTGYNLREHQMEQKTLVSFRRKYHLSQTQQNLLREQGMSSNWPHP